MPILMANNVTFNDAKLIQNAFPKRKLAVCNVI